MAGSPSFKSKLLILAALVLLLTLTHAAWMAWMGALLVHGEEPFHADVIVVLAGDPYGYRILKAAELVKNGFAPRVLVSGAPGFYDLHECDLAIPFAVKHGYPAEWFIPFPHDAHSTEDEARALWPELHRRHARQVIVVTSDYHTRRAGRTLRARWPDTEIRMVAVRDEFFSPDGWWYTREGRKTFFLEWTKMFASFAGL